MSRLRLPDRPDDLRGSVEEILDRVAGITPVMWSVGSSAAPSDLPSRLSRMGMRAPDPPLEPVCAAMTLTVEPAFCSDVQVRELSLAVAIEAMYRVVTWQLFAGIVHHKRNSSMNEVRRFSGTSG